VRQRSRLRSVTTGARADTAQCGFVTRFDARKTHRFAFSQLGHFRAPSFVVFARGEAYLGVIMTNRKRNRLIDLGLAALVVLACIGTATVTLAGKL
jgi:hypothetical protein